MSPILAVDWGMRRIGLAISDSGHLGRPLPTLEVASRRQAELRVAAAAREHGADHIVLGLPLQSDGTEGDSAATVRRLARSLEYKGYLVSFQDERHSSEDAQAMIERLGAKSNKKSRVDQVAALLILRDYLEAHPGALD